MRESYIENCFENNKNVDQLVQIHKMEVIAFKSLMRKIK